jgi:hypothetical protein
MWGRSRRRPLPLAHASVTDWVVLLDVVDAQWGYGARGGFQPSNYDMADSYFVAKFTLKV